jgi:hypothetical protein
MDRPEVAQKKQKRQNPAHESGDIEPDEELDGDCPFLLLGGRTYSLIDRTKD